MIQICTTYYSPLLQENYDNFIESLNFSSLSCSKCNYQGNCTRHAFYTRNIVTTDGKVPIRILRVQCGQCGSTHALLPDWIVPYSQILLVDHLEIISRYEDGESPHRIKASNPEIDTWIVVHIIKQYLNHWKYRLRSNSISLSLHTKQLVRACFKHHSRQFMQIKCTLNSLFIPTT